MKAQHILRSVLVIATLICGLWSTSALAVPNYSFSGYTNSLLLNDGDFQGYGNFSLSLAYDASVATTASSSLVDGLRGKLSFTQDPFIYTDPNDPYLPTGSAVNGSDFWLPGDATTFGGTFDELFALSYNSSLNQLSLDFMDEGLQGLVPMLWFDLGVTNFNLLGTTGLIDLTAAQIIGGEIAGTINGYAVAATTDEISYAAPVPEPSTFALLGLGIVGFGIARRVRSRKEL